MTLRDDILADPACSVALAARDCTELARIRSIGRTRATSLEIGNGTILETIGITSGNKLLDTINGTVDFRYVKPLVEQGRLLIGSALVQATLQSLVAASVITQVEADKLCALGKEPNPYTPSEIADALFNPDGTPK